MNELQPGTDVEIDLDKAFHRRPLLERVVRSYGPGPFKIRSVEQEGKVTINAPNGMVVSGGSHRRGRFCGPLIVWANEIRLIATA